MKTKTLMLAASVAFSGGVAQAVLSLILCSSFGGWMLWVIVDGIRSGQIRHTDSTSLYVFKDQPARFILVTLFFSLFAGGSLYLAFQSVISIWHRFQG